MHKPDEDDRETPELNALSSVVRALQALPAPARKRVIDSALILLGGAEAQTPSPSTISHHPGAPSGGTPGPAATDIRQLKEQKQPRSATEMAALVAYYLSELAPPNERKDTIELADAIKYFKQAPFRIPANTSMTLVAAKNAGYLDAVGGGKYKLNPVGYNLVVHSMPRAGADGGKKAPRKRAARGSRRRKNK